MDDHNQNAEGEFGHVDKVVAWKTAYISPLSRIDEFSV